MRTRLARAAPQSSAARLQTGGGADDARAALTSWLLGAHVQVTTGIHAGAAAGWIDRDGNAAYLYPEITGYYLQWLAWHAACRGPNDDTRRRAAAAQRWLLSWACGAGSPETRVYFRPTERELRVAAGRDTGIEHAVVRYQSKKQLRHAVDQPRVGLNETGA